MMNQGAQELFNFAGIFLKTNALFLKKHPAVHEMDYITQFCGFFFFVFWVCHEGVPKGGSPEGGGAGGERRRRPGVRRESVAETATQAAFDGSVTGHPDRRV